MTDKSANSHKSDGIEHPTPTCPNCGGNKTRPLDDKWATCFDCGDDWMMTEETRRELSPGSDEGGDR